MATGDANDIKARLISVLPPWFGDNNPIRDAVLAMAASVMAFIYNLYAYAKAQTRIATATGIWLDIIAFDFFGMNLLLMVNESDDLFRIRIMLNLFRPKATRLAISEAVEAVTGAAPTIIEPFSPGDCGAYGAPNSGYGVIGAYGSMSDPAAAFLITKRPVVAGIANIGGYSRGPWGYGVGLGCYAEPGSVASIQAIYDVIAATKAEGVQIWVAFDDYSAVPYLVTDDGSILVTDDGAPITI